MNTKKSIQSNRKELRKQYTICLIVYLLMVNFIFQITLSFSPLLNLVLILTAIFIIHRLFISILHTTASLLVPNKLVDYYRSKVKLHDVPNEQMRAVPSSIQKKT